MDPCKNGFHSEKSSSPLLQSMFSPTEAYTVAIKLTSIYCEFSANPLQIARDSPCLNAHAEILVKAVEMHWIRGKQNNQEFIE